MCLKRHLMLQSRAFSGDMARQQLQMLRTHHAVWSTAALELSVSGSRDCRACIGHQVPELMEQAQGLHRKCSVGNDCTCAGRPL